MLCVAGFDGRLQQVNPAWTACLGWTAEELTSRPMLDFVHPDDHAATLESRERIHRGEPRRGFENRYRCKDGSYRWLSWSIHPLPESRQVFGVVRDATERRKIADALGRNESLLRMATQVSRLGAWQVEVPTLAVTWSDELRVIFETPPDFTPTVENGLNSYAPEFQKRIRQVFGACVEQGHAFDEELQIITVRGKRVWVRILGEAVRDEAGKIIRVQGAFQDISERKDAEIAQLELSQRLTTTLESITDGFFTLDSQWRFSYVNAEAERLIVRQRSDLLGTTVWDAFPGTLGRTFEREYRRAVAENVAVSFEDYYPQLDKWFEVRAYPSAVGLAVYFRDVTASRQAAQVLRVSEERFRLLAKATNDAIWDWDLTTQSLWWNEGFETLFGFSRTEVESTIDSWLNRLHPEDQAAVVADVHRAINGGAESWQGEYRFRRKDGRYVAVLDRGHIIREPGGKAVRMIGGMTDLTELKQADEKLREQAALLDNAHDAIMVRDATHHITYWNKAAERLYGWTAAEAHGRPIQDLLHIDAARFAEAERAIHATGVWNGEIQKTAKSGTLLTVECSWTLLRDGQGAPRSILTIDTDITERKKLEQQFLRAQRMESIGTLAGGIAHDLNNLLAPITMGVDLLKLFEPHPKSLPVIENIERSAKRGAELVKQVLSFARGVEGARVALQVRHILKEVDAIAVNTFPKSITVETSLPTELWPVLADPTQLNQVVLNLCVNARDAMPAGGRLELTASNVDIDPQYAVMNRGMVPGRHVLIQVSDTGTGMPQEIIDRIFEPFFTTKELGKGTGLGLSTVLGIVRSHGGFVNVYSEVGRGSTFKVYLPAHEADEGPVADHRVAEALPRGNGELILVVDDETSILDITKQTLVAFGYRVLTAEDGAQAISLYALQRDEVVLVLTDMMMPVMDGATLILALQRINPRVRVIAASGLKGNHDVARASSAGVKHFLPKPYSADTLLQLVHQILRNEGSRPPV
jgi:PAS domain S-box-containing protein